MEFKIGDIIIHKTHKKGVVKNIDKKNKMFYYYCEFPRPDGDGTKVWLSKTDAEGNCKHC